MYSESNKNKQSKIQRAAAAAAMSGELSEKTTENAINIIYGLIATEERRERNEMR